MLNTLVFEIHIMIICLVSLPVTLNNVYMQSKGKVVVGTKKTMFVWQLISGSLWITLGVLTKQWFMLLSALYNIFQTFCILRYTKQKRKYQ